MSEGHEHVEREKRVERESREEGNRERGKRGQPEIRRPERQEGAKRGKKSSFIVGWVTWQQPGNRGAGKPGCSQVTIGVESSQKSRVLGQGHTVTDGHRIMELRSQQSGSLSHGFCPL